MTLLHAKTLEGLRSATRPTYHSPIPEAVHTKLLQDSIYNSVTGAGTAVDPSTYARPKVGIEQRRLSDVELDWLYAHNDLARRICDDIVTDAMQSGYKIISRTDTDDTPGPSAGDARTILKDPHGFATALRDAARAARRSRFGAVLLATTRPREQWTQPLGADEEFARFLTIEKAEVMSRGRPIEDPTDEMFGQPEFYSIQPIVGGTTMEAVDVHPSRLFVVRGEPLPKGLTSITDGYDDSVLQQVWDAISQFGQTESAITSIVVNFETAVMSLSGLQEILATKDGALLLRERMAAIQESKSTFNAVVIDRDAGEEYERKFAGLTGLDTAWDRKAHSVAKAARMSMTRLFGMAPSGLATDDNAGRANWRTEIQSYRSDKLEPPLLRYSRWLHGQENLEVAWNQVEELTQAEKADVAYKTAQTREVYVRNNIVPAGAFKEQILDEHLASDWDEDELEVGREDVEAIVAGMLNAPQGTPSGYGNDEGEDGSTTTPSGQSPVEPASAPAGDDPDDDADTESD